MQLCHCSLSLFFLISSKSKLNLRPYQQKVLDAALTRNTLAFLPTGAGRHFYLHLQNFKLHFIISPLGKTLIAVYLIQARLDDLRKSIAEGGKKQMIFFIVPTKILSGQQKRYISNHWLLNMCFSPAYSLE